MQLLPTNGDVILNGTTNNSGLASASNAIGVDIKSAAAITAKNISITGKSESSFGIQSASILKATDKVELEGTSKNWVGVVTTGAITATNGLLSIKGTKGTATDAWGYQGININSNLTGASVSLIGTSYGQYGVQVQNVTVQSTSGDIYIEGTGRNTATTTGQNESSGTRIAGIVDAKGKATIKGTTSDAGLYQGLIISNTVRGSSVEITGTATNHIGAAVNNGAKVTAGAGDVIIIGASNTNEGVGVGTQSTNGGATISASAGSVKLDGASGSALLSKSGTAGVRFWGSNSVTAFDAINITGTVDTQATKSGNGVEFQRYGSASSLKTTNGDINITGTLTGNGGGSGVRTGESGWGAQAPMISAVGNFNLRGNNRASTSNVSAAISASGGMQVSAGGNIVVQAETNNAAVAAMSFYSGGASVWGNALQANASFVTSKNVLIQVNQGGILFNNSITPTLTSGVAPNLLTALTDIQGKNITIDNTGAGMVTGATNIVGSGTINAITGAVTTEGSGGATGGTSGVNIDSRAISATGNLNIMGVARGTGSGTVSNAALTANGAVNLTGKAVIGTGLVSAGAVKSNNDAVSIIGSSTDFGGGRGADIQGMVTADSDINLEGYSANTNNVQGLLIRNSVNSTAGDITVKGQTNAAFQRAVAITANGANNGSLKVADGKTININANTLLINNLTSTFIDAGSNGKVNIKTLTAGNEIKIGFPDGTNSTLSRQILGIDNFELNRITAGNTVIGDTASEGKISIAGATTTLAQTGNITLQTGGDISVNASLKIASGKTLALNGAGASSNVSQANNIAGITAEMVEFWGSNAAVSLQPSGNSVNKIGTIAGNVKSFALTNQSDLKVGIVNGTTGLKAVNDINLTTTTLTGTALSIEKNIESIAGNVIINATTSDTSDLSPRLAAVKSSAEVKGKDITMNAVALGKTGKTLGYFGAGANGVFKASHDMKLIGSTKNQGSGFYMFEGGLSAGNVLSIEGTSELGQGVGFDKAPSALPNVTVTSGNSITITGTASNSTSSVPQAAINLKDVNLTNTAGAVTLTAINGDINTSGTGTLNQYGNDGVKLTTLGHGNITVPKVINNGTGNVVIAAGSDLLAGNRDGGQVKTVSGNTIAQNNIAPGKTYIYSGSAADTGLLRFLDGSFSELRLSGDMGGAQNADSNVKYAEGTTIASGANAQVMFREKIALNTSTIKGATLDKRYGDTNTTSASVDQIALFTEMQTQLKQANLGVGEIITRSLDGTNGAGEFKISKAAVINNMTGLLSAPVYSTSDHLTAKTHDYGALTSSKYTATLDAGKAQVEVNKLVLTGASIGVASNIYGGTVGSGAVDLTATNKIGTDVLGTGTASVVSTAGDLSTSGNLKANIYNQKVTGLSGTDAGNYDFTGVTSTGNYTVNKLVLTGASIGVASNIYGGTVGSGAVDLTATNKIGTDVLGIGTASVVSTAGDLSTSGNLKANIYNQKVTGLSGTDAGNYDFTGVTSTGNYTVNKLVLTGASIGVASNIYGGTVGSGAVDLTATNKIGTDVLGTGTASVVSTAGDLSTSGNLKANIYNQKVTGLSGTDAGNYDFTGVTSTGNYTVNKLVLTGASIGVASNIYGGTVGSGAVDLTATNKIGTDVLGTGTASVVSTAGDLSTSGNLKANIYNQKVTGLSGTDAGNYDFTGMTSTGNYTVNKLVLTGASIGVASNIYGGTVGSGAVDLTATNKIGTDVLGTGTASVVSTAGDLSTSGNLKANIYNQKVTGLSGTDAGNYDFTGVTSTGNYTVGRRDVTISAAGNAVIFNSELQKDTVSDGGGFIRDDKVGDVVGAGTGTEAGTYQSNLALTGDTSDISNYAVSYKNAAFTISAQTYVRPPVETNILSPVSFGLAYAGGATAAGGDGVDIAASCDAWSQRAGTGSVAVMTLLKSTFMGLRNAKTDSMDAMSGGSASASAVEVGASPCASSLANKQAGL
jgi:hypothetical protein